jgi:hypothetical protein
MVWELCSRKGTSGQGSRLFVRIAPGSSPNFRKIVRISDLAYFFAKIYRIWQDLAKNRRKHMKKEELNSPNLDKSNSYG